MVTPLQAIDIQIDYTYDTGNFFNTDEKKAAMEAAADFFGEMIDDTLLRIDPADFLFATWTAKITNPTTGLTEDIVDPVIPENVIIIYVGARSLPGSTVGLASTGGFSAGGFQSWFDRIKSRGQTGALTTPATDTSTWGGSIAFDTDVTWNFSQTSNGTGFEFMNTALHEIAHILGIGTADAWDDQISGGTFTGTAATRSNGGSAPNADFSHFQNNLTSTHFGSFGVTHGASIPVLMLPSLTDTGTNFNVATDLDLAAFVDLGWEVNPDPSLRALALSPSGVSLIWNSVSFKEYAVERATVLPSFGTVQASADGDATIQSWSDPTPPATNAFYQLNITSLDESVSGSSLFTSESVRDSGIRFIQRDPVTVECRHH